jgi:serine/threonine protein kinase
MKLVEKEKKSTYYKDCWPIVYDRYQPLFLLGSGGFGEVYKCYDLEKSQYVALKLIDISEKIHQEEDRDFFKRLQRESEIQQELSHPNIAKFHSLVEMNENQSKIVF